MKALPFDSPNLRANLASLIPPDSNVVVMHLGRGGVTEKGTLDSYNKSRVLQTLNVAAKIEAIRPRAKVRVLWTGGHNRQQDRTGAKPLVSEARAAFDYASTLVEDDMLTEENSTSTVENATHSREMVAANDTIVVVTDKLHYAMRKVQFIFWMAFPRHRVIFVELLKSPPDTNAKKVLTHVVSTTATVLCMILFRVPRGDAAAIQRRQEWLQKYTGH